MQLGEWKRLQEQSMQSSHGHRNRPNEHPCYGYHIWPHYAEAYWYVQGKRIAFKLPKQMPISWIEIFTDLVARKLGYKL